MLRVQIKQNIMLIWVCRVFDNQISCFGGYFGVGLGMIDFIFKYMLLYEIYLCFYVFSKLFGSCIRVLQCVYVVVVMVVK